MLSLAWLSLFNFQFKFLGIVFSLYLSTKLIIINLCTIIKKVKYELEFMCENEFLIIK